MIARLVLTIGLLLVAAVATPAQPLDSALYAPLKWRCIGPFRAGRTVGATGVPGKPNLFYVGVNNGGVWKTTDAGRVWTPIFDDQPTGSIGALALAPSDPNTIYVGTGEANGGSGSLTYDANGIYKSIDAGLSWTNVGLQNTRMTVGAKESAVYWNREDARCFGKRIHRGAARDL
jgi:hypothetical protein